MSYVRALIPLGLLCLALVWPPAAPGQAFELPVPATSYPDEDPAAAVYPSLDPADPAVERALQDALRRDRRNVTAMAQLALLQAWRGPRGRWERDYERAAALAPAGSPEARYVRWSWGWALFAGGDFRGALTQWRAAEQAHGGRPYWVPATYAIVLWAMGERELALQFFAVAAREQPQRWGSAEATAATVARWRPNERFAAESLAARHDGHAP